MLMGHVQMENPGRASFRVLLYNSWDEVLARITGSPARFSPFPGPHPKDRSASRRAARAFRGPTVLPLATQRTSIAERSLLALGGIPRGRTQRTIVGPPLVERSDLSAGIAAHRYGRTALTNPWKCGLISDRWNVHMNGSEAGKSSGPGGLTRSDGPAHAPCLFEKPVLGSSSPVANREYQPCSREDVMRLPVSQPPPRRRALPRIR